MPSHPESWYTLAVYAADLVLRLGFSLRVVLRRLPVGVSLAWLTVILVFPFGGTVVYLMFGELRLGRWRARRAAAVHRAFRSWFKDLQAAGPVDWTPLGQACEPLARLAEAVAEAPPLPGNQITLLDDAEEVFRSLIADIDAARHTCHLAFYIWGSGGLADEVAAALIRAQGRGVACRILVDAVGSRPFLRGEQARTLRQNGVEVREALPAGFFRMLFVRFDLRLHRKIVVLDGEVAYTGSLNLVDPRFFKQDAGVGHWVDAMVRVRGPAVTSLSLTFLEDWETETGEDLKDVEGECSGAHLPGPQGNTVVQVLPSGPAGQPHAIQGVLLQAIYLARRELILTTPYFVPDELLLTALASAAQRGVQVKLVVPAHVDSRLVRLASAAQRGDLASAGVSILEYGGGLLHTKSVTVDGELSLFGSLNLDPRSLNLNFEITLALYDRQFTSELVALQQTYLASCQPFDLAAWQRRSPLQRLLQDLCRLLSPLL